MPDRERLKENIVTSIAAGGIPLGQARLLALVLVDGPQQQRVAAAALGITAGMVSKHVAWLVQRGLVRREPGKHRNRITVTVAATRHARAWVRDRAGELAQAAAAAQEGVSRDEGQDPENQLGPLRDMAALRWRRRRRVLVKDHNPVAHHQHPLERVPVRYCVCGEAVIDLGGVWYHLVRVPPPKSKRRAGP